MNNRIHTFSFTEPFIDRLADFIHAQYIKPGKDLSRIAIVFGGKRPSLFLKRELARKIKSSFVSPHFLTIDDFIHRIVFQQTQFKNILDLDHSYVIYQLAREAVPQILKGRESFAQFLPWTIEILKFIDHLDLEMVPSSALRNIEANAEIGYSVPHDINRLLEHISVLREAYHRYLKEQKAFSRGFQYLWAAEHISKIKFPEYDDILFCNFFYLHRTELTVIESLFERKQAQLFFQGDERRWPALKRLSKAFDAPIVEAEEVKMPQFNLKLYAAFDIHVQAALVRDILKTVEDPEKTVVVLPDPEALIPLLSEISSVVSEFNVSMGYPLQRSSLFSLLDFIFHAQLSRRKNSYYARDYLKALRHPFVKNLKLFSNPSAMRVVVHKLEEMLTGQAISEISGKLFFTLDEIEHCQGLYTMTKETLNHMGIEVAQDEMAGAIQAMHRVLFYSWESVSDFKAFAGVLREFLTIMVEKSFMEAYPLNIKISQRIFDLADEFERSQFARETFPREEMFKIFKSRIEQELISFQGSPLKGLQILGLFETRSLNFEDVIVLDVNEGVLPYLKIYEPLIPREVMIKLNLDRLELEEEIQRYQFMRLLSSAKNVHLIYREGTDKEKSRFVEELVWEEEKKSKRINSVEVVRPGFEVKVVPYAKKAVKTAAMIEFLKHFRYSASSVNTYVRNPYEFYQNYVLGLREKEDLLDEPENRQVGIFVHGLLQDTFGRFLGKTIGVDADFRRYFMKSFEERFAETFGRSMNSDGFLLKAVLESRLARFLDNEERRHAQDPAKLLYIEKRFEDVIPLSSGPMRFAYQVDRVDEFKDGSVMIIDYKTGSVDPMPKAIEKIASLELSRESIRDHVKSFQIPLYFYCLDKQFPGVPINAAFYNLRTMKMDRFITDKTKFERADINRVFLRALEHILSEILNPDVPFIYDEPPGNY